MTPDQIALRPHAVERANREPLPGALAVAWGKQDIESCGIKVRPFQGGDFTIIKMLKSPIYRQMLELAKEKGGEEIEPSDYEIWDMIYLLTHPAIECHKLVQRGVETFREAAINFVVSNEYSLPQIAELFLACVEQCKRHFTAQIQYGQSKEGKEGEENFTTDTVALPKTG